MSEHKHNLLGHEHSPPERRRRKILRVVGQSLLVFVLLVFAAGLVLVVPSLGAMRVIYANAQAGKDDLYRAKDAAETLDFQKASEALSDGVIHLETAHDATNRLGLVAKLPFLKKEVEAVRDVLEGGRNAAFALREAIDVGADLLSVFKTGLGAQAGVPSFEGDGRAVSQLSKDDRRLLLQKMIEAPDRLGMARDALDRALAAFDRIPATPLTEGILASIAPQKAKLIELRGYLSQDLSILSKIPLIIGYPEPKTYLFLLLNNTEIRPGGGFIGTYGIVKLADGDIASFFTDDIYKLDGPAEAYLKETPPEPLKKYLRAPGWFMRDANWSPDYVASSMEVERFYHLEGGTEKIDGIIGITPTLISRLLEVTGPITIDGSTFDAKNLADELEYQVERGFAQNGVPYFQRKDIVGQLGDELVNRLLATPISKLPLMAKLAETAVDEKHLMAWFKDPKLQAVADDRDWSGRLPVPTADGLLVVDANLAALKTDPAMERTISYKLRPEGGSWIARAEVKYRHNGRFDWKTTRYRTYTRFYAPMGSTFIKGEGMMQDDKLNDPKRSPGVFDVGTEHGQAVFGAFISIEPGETRTLAVEYRVSDAVARMIRNGDYHLDARKQLGTPGHRLTLDLDFGKNVARATPSEERIDWGDGRYRLTTDLVVDRGFTVDFAK
jgi:hypothetical protein